MLRLVNIYNMTSIITSKSLNYDSKQYIYIQYTEDLRTTQDTTITFQSLIYTCLMHQALYLNHTSKLTTKGEQLHSSGLRITG